MGSAIDITPRQTLGITTVPAGPIAFIHSGPWLATALGATIEFNVSLTPPTPILSMWSSLWSITVDTDDVNHVWPSGSGLSGQTVNNTIATSHWDYLTSQDSANIRAEMIYVQNTDTVNHTFWLYYKFYSQPNVASSGAGQSITA